MMMMMIIIMIIRKINIKKMNKKKIYILFSVL